MGKEYVDNAIQDLEQLAKQEGLDFFPTIFEYVSRDTMLEACSYGLPVRCRHWSYGKSYDHQKLYGEMGLSRVYEIVFNNNPAYAFLLDTNPDIINIMVAAHVFGHAHVFKNNVMFQGSDRNMVRRAAERASRVDEYVELYGIDKVEHLMDIGFALDSHIDWNKGLFRKKYPKKRTIAEENPAGEFEDLLNSEYTSRRSIRYRTVGENFPPHPEKDLLWFLSNYANLEEWERDVLGIIREEAYYFYPIVVTKILNEGAASFFHAELMLKYDKLSEEEYLEFCKTHSGVVSPGNPFSINPYYLGFKIFTDIRERWDELHKNGESAINGIQKVIEVIAEEDDASFLRNYLTTDLATEMGMFSYGYRHARAPGLDETKLDEKYGIIEIKDRELDSIIENIIRPTVNYGSPLITIDSADGDALVLHHRDTFGPLNEQYTEKTMGFIYELWGGPIELKTYVDDTEVTYCYDEAGFDIL